MNLNEVPASLQWSVDKFIKHLMSLGIEFKIVVGREKSNEISFTLVTRDGKKESKVITDMLKAYFGYECKQIKNKC